MAASPSAATAIPSSGARVAASSSRYGKILADGSGRTLYLFDIEQGGVPKCYGLCAGNWPPFLAASASSADPNLTPTLIAISARNDGSQQVTYNGHPLYYYVGDTSAGDIKCQAVVEFGGGWYVIDTKGNKISAP